MIMQWLERQADRFLTWRWRKLQLETINERLARRYDPAPVLAEATKRAIAAKRASPQYRPPETPLVEAPHIRLDGSPESWAALAAHQKANPEPHTHEVTELSPRQQAALRVQQQQAHHTIRDA
jgi:hypothetical protein